MIQYKKIATKAIKNAIDKGKNEFIIEEQKKFISEFRQLHPEYLLVSAEKR